MKEFLQQQKGKLILLAGMLLAVILFFVLTGHRGDSMPNVVYMLPNGAVFEPETAENGTDIKVPDNPQMPEGFVFSGWEFERLTSEPTEVAGSAPTEVISLDPPPRDESGLATEPPATQAPQPTPKPGKTVLARAVAVSVSKDENVVALSGGYGTKGNTVTLSLTLCGKADICAFEAEVTYDPNLLEFQELANEDFCVVSNVLEDEGRILLNFVDTENVEADVDLMDIVFKVKGSEAGTTPISLLVKNGTRYGTDEELEEVEINAIPAAVEIV